MKGLDVLNFVSFTDQALSKYVLDGAFSLSPDTVYPDIGRCLALEDGDLPGWCLVSEQGAFLKITYHLVFSHMSHPCHLLLTFALLSMSVI